MEPIYILKLPEHLWSVLKHCPLFTQTGRTCPGRCVRLTWAVRNAEAASAGRKHTLSLIAMQWIFFSAQPCVPFPFQFSFADMWMLTDTAIIILQGRSQAAFGKSYLASSMNSSNVDHLSTTGVQALILQHPRHAIKSIILACPIEVCWQARGLSYVCPWKIRPLILL